MAFLVIDVALSSAFLEHAGAARASLAAEPDLESLLANLLAAGRTAWPDVVLAPETFLRHLAERLPPEDPATALRGLHASDLYLACACVTGDRRALGAFETHFLAQVSTYLGRADALSGFADEVKQAVRTRLLLAQGSVPRIASYNGRGPLAGWLRMVAARLAVDLHREQKPRAEPEDEIALMQDVAPADPELAYIKEHYRGVLEAALRAALAQLPAQDANILRLHFLEGMPSPTLGALYQVSGRTVNRWIADIRQRILDEARALAGPDIGGPGTNLDSVLALVRSQISLSVAASLKKPEE